MDHSHHPNHNQHSKNETIAEGTEQKAVQIHHLHTENFLKRFWICLILTIPVLLLSHMVQQWFGFHIRFAGDQYLLLGLSSIIYFYGGMPFLKGIEL